MFVTEALGSRLVCILLSFTPWASREGGPSLKGCQIVAGGRSETQTTGQQSKIIPHPERVSEKRWHPCGVRTRWALLSGGLRYAATTGYYLTALQAEIRSLRFHTASGSDMLRAMSFHAKPFLTIQSAR